LRVIHGQDAHATPAAAVASGRSTK